jgi:DNA-binding response OmpR family regulator
MAAINLLVVDDDPSVTRLIERYFASHGFAVSSAHDGAQLRAHLDSQPVDVVLLDLGLPGEDGLALTRYLRERWHGALIIVTGRGESVERIVGLELGADDYVTKPFELRELLARVRSVLRRTAGSRVASDDANDGSYAFHGWRLDSTSRGLSDPSGDPVPLTTGEYGLLLTLLQAAGRVLTRDFLIEQIYGREAGPYDRTIDVQIGRLRKKLRDDPANPSIIKSVRGAGYLFAPPVHRGKA